MDKEKEILETYKISLAKKVVDLVNTISEIAKFLREHRVPNQKIRRCEERGHEGLTYKCFKDPADACVTCLACEVEEILGFGEMGYVCGVHVYVDGQEYQISKYDALYKLIPELSEEDVIKFRALLTKLEDIVRDIRDERLNLFEDLLTEVK